MKRLLLYLLPATFRRRDANELIELLENSDRPVRDALDVVLSAARLGGEQLITNAARHLANLLIAVALFTLGYVVNDLDDGIVEVPHHWWSMSAALLVGAAAAVRVTVAIASAKRVATPESASS